MMKDKLIHQKGVVSTIRYTLDESKSSHDVFIDGIIFMAWSLFRTVCTGVIKSNLVAMIPATISSCH
jgi:hypothetical protein